ncbi:MAG: LLM class flavin-dependent oxidoreductase [Chloroflexi bacterium]|nr:LLM class flavin-dependent oxidoreductase [Chloroflexota bacterium]
MKAGFAIPQVFPDGPVDLEEIRTIALKAESLGFDDLWTQEQVVGSSCSLEPLSLLSYLAAITDRIRLGVSVLVLPQREPIWLAKVVATLDQLSKGRVTVGVGLGSDGHDAAFGVGEKRVRRFVESIQLIDSLWKNGATTLNGDHFNVENLSMQPKPVQSPRPPLWIGARVPAAVKRAVKYGDGWMGQGSASTELFAKNAKYVRELLDAEGRDPASFAVSKRIYVAIDDDADSALKRLESWFGHHYGRPQMASEVSLWGPAETVYQQLDKVVDAGAQHLMLNPVFDYDEHLEALAEYVGSRN